MKKMPQILWQKFQNEKSATDFILIEKSRSCKPLDAKDRSFVNSIACKPISY